MAEILYTLSGAGWLLLVLLGLAVAIYHTLFLLWQYLRHCDVDSAPISVDGSRSLDDLSHQLQESRMQQLEFIDRRLPFLYVLISAAPLTGLLGTVTGMLPTFRGLGSSSSQTPIDLISQGISQALITTQAGLIIAIPASIAAAFRKSRRDALDQAWAQCESQLSQQWLRHRGEVAA